jgi:hypothetical protein
MDQDASELTYLQKHDLEKTHWDLSFDVHVSPDQVSIDMSIHHVTTECRKLVSAIKSIWRNGSLFLLRRDLFLQIHQCRYNRSNFDWTDEWESARSAIIGIIKNGTRAPFSFKYTLRYFEISRERSHLAGKWKEQNLLRVKFPTSSYLLL